LEQKTICTKIGLLQGALHKNQIGFDTVKGIFRILKISICIYFRPGQYYKDKKLRPQWREIPLQCFVNGAELCSLCADPLFGDYYKGEYKNIKYLIFICIIRI